MKDNSIDNYIENAEPFARPVLMHLRALVHTALPEVQEAIKWNFPNFLINGKIVCSMAAFKNHCAFNFWQAAELDDPDQILETSERTSMGNLGRISRLEDLPSDAVLIKYIRNAARQRDEGPKAAVAKTSGTKNLILPDYFERALDGDPKARETFVRFSYSNQKEYVDWLSEAKTEATRAKRLASAIEWLNEGKIRNWKYVKK